MRRRFRIGASLTVGVSQGGTEGRLYAVDGDVNVILRLERTPLRARLRLIVCEHIYGTNRHRISAVLELQSVACGGIV